MAFETLAPGENASHQNLAYVKEHRSLITEMYLLARPPYPSAPVLATSGKPSTWLPLVDS